MANKPIKKWRSGLIESCVWLNSKKISDTEEAQFKTVSVSRSYKKKGDDTWRNEVINLRRGDIPKMILVLQKAQEELLLSQEDDENAE